LDVVGFSAAALRCSAEEAFRELKTMFHRIGRIIGEHGGTVDRTIGDGLLAYFVDDGPSESHADRALRCGARILEEQVADMLSKAPSTSAFVLPVRIGINSGLVIRGNLGSDEHPDFTVVGSVVNLGQRFEAACENNRIVVGASTIELSRSFRPTTPGMTPRPVIAKSYLEPIAAYELDPFVGAPDRARRAIAAYRAFAGLSRKEERLACTEAAIVMQTSAGFARVENVSASGMLLRCDEYLARNAVLHATDVLVGIEHLPVPHLLLQVRWGAPSGDGSFLHGCLLANLDAEQRAELWSIWCQCIVERSEVDVR
jgi:class 3 adenylate cyclase